MYDSRQQQSVKAALLVALSAAPLPAANIDLDTERQALQSQATGPEKSPDRLSSQQAIDIVTSYVNEITKNGTERPYGRFEIEDFAQLYGSQIRALRTSKNPESLQRAEELMSKGQELVDQQLEKQRTGVKQLGQNLVDAEVAAEGVIQIRDLEIRRPSSINGITELAIRVTTGDTRAIYTFQREITDEKEFTMRLKGEPEVTAISELPGLAKDPVFRDLIERTITRELSGNGTEANKALDGVAKFPNEEREALTQRLKEIDPTFASKLVTSTIVKNALVLGIELEEGKLALLQIGLERDPIFKNRVSLSTIKDRTADDVLLWAPQ